METFLIFGGFVLGLILLVKGADEMVKSAIQIAVKFKLPNSVIGATFIGFGTSAPELFTVQELLSMVICPWLSEILLDLILQIHYLFWLSFIYLLIKTFPKKLI